MPGETGFAQGRNTPMISISRWPWRLASLGIVAALAIPGGVALAAPSAHTTEHRLEVGGSIRADDAVVQINLTDSDLHGPGAHVEVWLPPDLDYLHPPTLVSGRAELQVAADESSLTGSVDLFYRETEQFAGQAVISASLAPFGPPAVVEDRNAGNHKVWRDEIYQPMSIVGSLTIPGRSGRVVLPMDGLFATVADLVQFTNAPSSSVFGQDSTGLELWWEIDGILVGIKGESDKAISWVDAAVILPDGTILNGAGDGATLDHRRIRADVAISPVNPGLAPAGGTVSVRADVSRGETERFVQRDGDDRLQVTLQRLIASGTVEVSLDDGTLVTLDFADAAGPFVNVNVRFVDGGRQG
ncbi:MAG: hypothetical protein LC798_16630 [Chloroflexi bacterium]|nr:hypothetical protein [Chloroflexota bacterium]